MKPEYTEAALEWEERAAARARRMATMTPDEAPSEVADEDLIAALASSLSAGRLVLEGTVERNAKKSGFGGVQGSLEIAVKKGGALTGKLSLDYLNNEFLAGLTRLGENRQPITRKITITIE